MEPGPQPTTIIPFTRRHRWRWWAMTGVGVLFVAYALALLTSPSWAYAGTFGVEGFWLWLRGEIYLIFGAVQVIIGIGYIRLTSRPAQAIIMNTDGVSVRRIHGRQHLSWADVTSVRRGRSSVLIATTPVTLWKTLMWDARLLRLDATMVDASPDTLVTLIERHAKAAGRLRATPAQQAPLTSPKPSAAPAPPARQDQSI